jgi:hypothetical protein
LLCRGIQGLCSRPIHARPPARTPSQEAARKAREEEARRKAAAARAAEHRLKVEERKAKYTAFKAKEAEMMARSEAAWREYQKARGE